MKDTSVISAAQRMRAATSLAALARLAALLSVASSAATAQVRPTRAHRDSARMSVRWSGDTSWTTTRRLVPGGRPGAPSDSVTFVVREVMHRANPDTVWRATFRDGRAAGSEVWVFHGDSSVEIVGHGRYTGMQAKMMRGVLANWRAHWLLEDTGPLLPPAPRRPPT